MSSPDSTFRSAVTITVMFLLLHASMTPALGAETAPSPKLDIDDARGIVVSCWRWGYEWADPQMRELMVTLPQVGANWLSIHPYAHVSKSSGGLRWSAKERVDHIVKPIRWAHELGLKIMVKPHLSYWGEFTWRGEIGWGSDELKWQRFLKDYRSWILHLAKICQQEGADLFVVGTELRHTESMEDFWISLIAEVREVYSGPLTYAANWDDFESIEFWEELDYIGVQAYFPLVGEEDPTDDARLRAGWKGPVDRMSRLSRKTSRPVILTEIGYTNAPWTAATPWRSSRGKGATEVQERCLKTALEVAAETEAIRGVFIWKWFPTTRAIGPSDFTVQTEAFKKLIATTWARGIPKSTTQPAP